MTSKCASLVAIAAVSVAGTLAGSAAAASASTLDSNSANVSLNLNPAVKTAAALAYLGRSNIGIHIPLLSDHVDAGGGHFHHTAQLPGGGLKGSEGSFNA